MSNPTDELTILNALVTKLETITGLNAYAFPTTNMITPWAVPMLTIPYDDDWNARTGPIKGRIMVFCKVGTTQSGAKELLEFTSATGSKSIHQKLISDRTLSGACVDLRSPGPLDDAYLVMNNEGEATFWARSIAIEIYT